MNDILEICAPKDCVTAMRNYASSSSSSRIDRAAANCSSNRILCTMTKSHENVGSTSREARIRARVGAYVAATDVLYAAERNGTERIGPDAARGVLTAGA